jgi:regulatory protein
VTHGEAFKKATKYCAYQDRCQQEVRNKLYDMGAPHESIESIISDLISDNFLNEERFATSYARGKFYYKDWGRQKIVKELKQRKISEYCLRKAMLEIKEEDYFTTIDKLITKKGKQLGNSTSTINKSKIANFLFNKGYESNLIWEALKSA